MKSPFNKTFMAKSPFQANGGPEKKLPVSPSFDDMSYDDASRILGKGTKEYSQFDLYKRGLLTTDDKLKTGGAYAKYDSTDFKKSRVQ